jgi:hypothetical protein
MSFNQFYGYTVDSLIIMMATGFNGEFLSYLLTPLGRINLFGQGITSREAAQATKFLLENLEAAFGQKPERVKLVPGFALQGTIGYDNFMTDDYKQAPAYIIWRRNPSTPKPEDALIYTTVSSDTYKVTQKGIEDIQAERKKLSANVKPCDEQKQ